jgi:FlaG/FlaF family flagellin (archaellin)
MIQKLRLRADARAISAVIGVITLVAITVVLAGSVFVLVNGFSGKDAKPPPTVNLAGTMLGTSLQIVHLSGDTIQANEWRLSITQGAASNPAFMTCTQSLVAGSQLLSPKTTVAAPGNCLAGGLGADIVAGTVYVVIFHIPSKTTIYNHDLDTN